MQSVMRHIIYLIYMIYLQLMASFAHLGLAQSPTSTRKHLDELCANVTSKVQQLKSMVVIMNLNIEHLIVLSRMNTKYVEPL